MKKFILSALMATAIFGNIAHANQCPPLDENIAKKYQQIEIKHCNEQHEFWRVFQDGKMGIIDRAGKVIIPFKYNYVEKYNDSSNYLIVGANGKNGIYPAWGVIDKTGKEAFGLQEGFIVRLSDNLFSVEVYDKEFMGELQEPYFNTNMTFEQIILDEVSQDLMRTLLGYDVIGKKFNARVGVIGDVDGTIKVLLPIEYDYIKEQDEEFFNIYKNGKAFLFDKNGEILK